MGNRLRDSGNEYGAVTGRPRRCGWYDAVAVRYGVRINGLDALALTKLDVLDGLETIEVYAPYKCGSRTLTDFPSDISRLAACEPIYEAVPVGRRPPGHPPLRGPAGGREAIYRTSRRSHGCAGRRRSRRGRNATTPSFARTLLKFADRELPSAYLWRAMCASTCWALASRNWIPAR